MVPREDQPERGGRILGGSDDSQSLAHRPCGSSPRRSGRRGRPGAGVYLQAAPSPGRPGAGADADARTLGARCRSEFRRAGEDRDLPGHDAGRPAARTDPAGPRRGRRSCLDGQRLHPWPVPPDGGVRASHRLHQRSRRCQPRDVRHVRERPQGGLQRRRGDVPPHPCGQRAADARQGRAQPRRSGRNQAADPDPHRRLDHRGPGRRRPWPCRCPTCRRPCRRAWSTGPSSRSRSFRR